MLHGLVDGGGEGAEGLAGGGDGVGLKVVVGELEGGKEAITANGMHVISIISTCIYTPSFSGTETIAPAGFHISRRQ
jgi:hypothetical protein